MIKRAALAIALVAATLAPVLLPSSPGSAAANDLTREATLTSAGAGTAAVEGGVGMSGNGRYVAFAAGDGGGFVPGDTNGNADWFVRDLLLETTIRASVEPSGGQSNGTGGFDGAALSYDGRYIAFSHDATNLVGGDMNNVHDVFRRDLQTETTIRVSLTSTGGESSAASRGQHISGDGNVVVFFTTAALVPGDTDGGSDVYARDVGAGTTELISIAPDGSNLSGSEFPRTNATGRYVVWRDGSHVYLRDRQAATTTQVTLDAMGGDLNNSSDWPSVSDDGRYVAFTSIADDVVPGHPNGISDVFVRDMQAGTNEQVSVTPAGSQPSNGGVDAIPPPVISGDGRSVVFASDSTDLVAGDTNGRFDAFVRDLVADTTERVSLSSSGTEANDLSGANVTPPNLEISRDGRYAAFTSSGTNLVTPNGTRGIFVRTRGLPTVSCPTNTTLASGATGNVAIAGTNFSDTPSVAFGAGVTVNSVTFNSPTSLSANVTVAGGAAAGDRTATVTNPSGDNASSGGCLTVSGGGSTSSSSSTTSSTTTTTTTAALPPATAVPGPVFTKVIGYLVIDIFGGVHNLGEAEFLGSLPGLAGGTSRADSAPGTPAVTSGGPAVGTAPIVGADATPTGTGYVLVDSQGGVLTFGAAGFRGSVPGLRDAGIPVGDAPIVDGAVTPTGAGYVILDAAGGVHAFGDAAFHGSLPGRRAAGEAVGEAAAVAIALAASGRGYVILDAAGGIHTFGDAAFHGSLPGRRAAGLPVGTSAVTGIDVAATGGYAIVDRSGGVHAFGPIGYHGSLPERGVVTEAVDVIVEPDGDGYTVLDTVGGMHAFGAAPFLGSLSERLGVPVLKVIKIVE